MPTREQRFSVLFTLRGTKPLLSDFISVKTVEDLARRIEAPPVVLLPLVPREGTEDAERMMALRKKAERLAEKLGAVTLEGTREEIAARLGELATAKLTVNEAGEPIIPGLALYASLRDAGVNVRISGKTPVTYKSSGTSLPWYVQLDDRSYTIGPKDWQPYFSLLANKADRQKKGDYRIAVYPRFEQWEISGTMEVLCEDGFTVEHARRLLMEAGKSTGLGAMRGERKGYVNFGAFEVTDFDVSPSSRVRMSLSDFQNRAEAK
jgi:hypothetical protein